MIIARHIEPEAKLRSAQTACPYCGVGCGVDIDFRGAEPVAISGSPEHPSNHGRLCVKGQHLLHTLGNDGRLLYPQVAGQRVSWQCALDKVAQGFSDIIARHGPDAVAFYVSGQILTEDYYVANKIMKGYIGSANIDTNSRLCMSSAVSAYKRAFGEDVVPCDYRDLEQTELLVLIGSNAAWTHPVLYQRMERAKRMNPALKVVLVDPRRTPTAELADLHLQISPGSDAGLYNGLLNYLQAEGGLDQAFIDRATEGSEQALAAAANWGLARSAEFCGLSEAQLLTFYQWFNAAERAISFYSMGINQSSSGVDKCQAIINAHLASGKILTPGSGPFSITGQPNAMGGREVGGMANQLAAHMDIDKPDQRQTLQDFWRSPTMASRPGKMAMDLFDDVSAGKIKALWIIGTNPMVSLSNRNAVAAALTRCELVVVSDCVAENDTLAYADIKLPATGWLEKDGTVTNSERRIYRQRGLVAAPGEAKHDWQILAEFARTMGYSGFDYQHPSDVFREWAQLTAHANNGQRQLDLGAISELDQRAYDQLAPQQWPLPKDGPSGKVFVGERFSTPTGRAVLWPIEPRLPVQAADKDYPWTLNSGRLRDHWHTMTRTGRVANLNSHIDRPCIYLNPADFAELGLQLGELVSARSKAGQVVAFAQASEDIARRQCFMPIHWSAQFASAANVSSVYASVADPISGQPESKQAAVQLAKFDCAQYLHIYSRCELKPAADFWVKSQAQTGYHYLLAMAEPRTQLSSWVQGLLGQNSKVTEWLGGTNSLLGMAAGRVELLAFADAQPLTLNKTWIEHWFDFEALDLAQVGAILRRQVAPEFLQGAKVCSCFGVHQQPIIDAIEAGADSVEALGQQLRCGTNCGSCKPELASLLQQHKPSTVAERSLQL